jgi:hypothetical protein
MSTDDLIAGLPGEMLVRQGLADFRSGLSTGPAVLVCIARPRLNRAGPMPASVPSQYSEAESQSYDLLKRGGGDAYSRDISLLRELISTACWLFPLPGVKVRMRASQNIIPPFRGGS